MSNQTAAAIAAITTSVNWERRGLDTQAIIEAANQGKLGKPLTDWLVAKGWESLAEIKEEAKEKFLEFVCDFILPAQSRFAVAEKFTKDNTKVKFYHIDSSFLNRFGSMVEKEVGETKAVVNKLLIPATFSDQTPELGDQRIYTCSQLYWLLSQQTKDEKPNGKTRRLLIDGSANLLRVLNKDRIESVVFARWIDGSGWGVIAFDLDYDSQWDAGRRAFSRK